MEKNSKRLVVVNGVLFAFVILTMVIQRVTFPVQLAKAINRLKSNG